MTGLGDTEREKYSCEVSDIEPINFRTLQRFNEAAGWSPVALFSVRGLDRTVRTDQ